VSSINWTTVLSDIEAIAEKAAPIALQIGAGVATGGVAPAVIEGVQIALPVLEGLVSTITSAISGTPATTAQLGQMLQDAATSTQALANLRDHVASVVASLPKTA